MKIIWKQATLFELLSLYGAKRAIRSRNTDAVVSVQQAKIELWAWTFFDVFLWMMTFVAVSKFIESPGLLYILAPTVLAVVLMIAWQSFPSVAQLARIFNGIENATSLVSESARWQSSLNSGVFELAQKSGELPSQLVAYYLAPSELVHLQKWKWIFLPLSRVQYLWLLRTVQSAYVPSIRGSFEESYLVVNPVAELVAITMTSIEQDERVDLLPTEVELLDMGLTWAVSGLVLMPYVETLSAEERATLVQYWVPTAFHSFFRRKKIAKGLCVKEVTAVGQRMQLKLRVEQLGTHAAYRSYKSFVIASYHHAIDIEETLSDKKRGATGLLEVDALIGSNWLRNYYEVSLDEIAERFDYGDRLYEPDAVRHGLVLVPVVDPNKPDIRDSENIDF